MLEIRYESSFKKAFKRAKKRGLNMRLLEDVIRKLANQEPLPPQARDHQLIPSRRYKDVRECHIQPDWLLIYRIVDAQMVLILVDTGTHSDLFE